MARKLGWVVIMLAAALPASAAGELGSISGRITDSEGVPQMGAAVQLLSANGAGPVTVFTDAKGLYKIRELLPGSYSLKVSATSFLPSLRENIAIHSGAQLIVNLTLSTLYEAMQLLPSRRKTSASDDEWKWTLRSVTNRPILRVLDDSSLVVVSSSEREDDRTLKAKVAFLAGSDAEGFGSGSELSTAFVVERSMFSSGTLAFDGRVGYGSGSPASVVRASYRHRMPNGSQPEVALTVRQFNTPETARLQAALQALSLGVSDRFTIGELLELNYGGEMQAIEFMGRTTAFRPFFSAGVHLSENTVLGYRYATDQPSTRLMKGFDSAPADLSESGPRMTLADGHSRVERARHQEISLSHRVGDYSFQVAYFTDKLRNAALIGVGDTRIGGDFLPDIFSGTFSYNGGGLETSGLRLVAQRKVGDMTATMDYAFGGVIALSESGLPWDDVQSSLVTQQRHSVAGKLAGSVPGARTRWITSYKWTSGSDALSPVDAFNASPGQADPYLNVFLRQPLPSSGFLPEGMEALVDVRNLLAEGYVPVVGPDGQTLYLVQAARSVRGGLAFTF